MHAEVQKWLDRGQFFDVRGNKIFYIQEGTGEPLLILHGYPYSSFEWASIWDELTKKYRVVIFDLLGMGFSDKPQNHSYSFQEHAEITNALLAFLKIDHVHILSHDLGVSIGQELIAQNNDADTEGGNIFKIDSITFMNGGLFMDVYQPRLIQKLLSQSPTFVGKFISKNITKAMTNKSVKALFGPDTQPSKAFLDQQWEILNYKNGKSIAYLIGRLVFEKNKYQKRWIEAMQTTAIPMCLINGLFDPNSGAHMAKRYKELIPNPLIYTLNENIGHWPFLEDEKTVLTAYFDFRDKIKRE